MIRLTNAEAAHTGKPIALNQAHIVSVFEAFDEERRVQMMDGGQYIVSETVEQILHAIAVADGHD